MPVTYSRSSNEITKRHKGRVRKKAKKQKMSSGPYLAKFIFVPFVLFVPFLRQKVLCVFYSGILMGH